MKTTILLFICLQIANCQYSNPVPVVEQPYVPVPQQPVVPQRPVVTQQPYVTASTSANQDTKIAIDACFQSYIGRRLVCDRAWQRVAGRTLQQCQSYCQRVLTCTGINYEPTTSVCELYLAYRSEGTSDDAYSQGAASGYNRRRRVRRNLQSVASTHVYRTDDSDSVLGQFSQSIKPINQDQRSTRALQLQFQSPSFLHPPTPADEFPQWQEAIDDSFINEQLRRSSQWQQQFFNEQKNREEQRLASEAAKTEQFFNEQEDREEQRSASEATKTADTFDRKSFAAQRQREFDQEEEEKKRQALLPNIYNVLPQPTPPPQPRQPTYIQSSPPPFIPYTPAPIAQYTSAPIAQYTPTPNAPTYIVPTTPSGLYSISGVPAVPAPQVAMTQLIYAQGCGSGKVLALDALTDYYHRLNPVSLPECARVTQTGGRFGLTDGVLEVINNKRRQQVNL